MVEPAANVDLGGFGCSVSTTAGGSSPSVSRALTAVSADATPGRRNRAKPLADARIREDHFARHMTEQSGAEPDHPREATHDRGEQTAADDHERDGKEEPENDQAHVSFGSACDCHDIVKAHHHDRR